MFGWLWKKQQQANKQDKSCLVDEHDLFVQGAESTFFSCYAVNTKQQYVSLPFPIALELPFLIESSSNEIERV